LRTHTISQRSGVGAGCGHIATGGEQRDGRKTDSFFLLPTPKVHVLVRVDLQVSEIGRSMDPADAADRTVVEKSRPKSSLDYYDFGDDGAEARKGNAFRLKSGAGPDTFLNLQQSLP
jgi:hypothetical protein